MEIRDRRDELLLLVAVSGELPAGWSGMRLAPIPMPPYL